MREQYGNPVFGRGDAKSIRLPIRNMEKLAGENRNGIAVFRESPMAAAVMGKTVFAGP